METNICPICGGVLWNRCALQDGEICGNCADDLRFAYPLLYLPKVGMLDDHPRCQNLRRKDLTFLKRHKGENVEFVNGGKRAPCYRFDFMQLLTIAEFKEQMVCADAEENRIRGAYQDYTNVLTVDYARPLNRTIGKKGVQNLRKRRFGFCATGFIRAGQFQEGDMVKILHNGETRYGDILCIYRENSMEDPEYGELRTRGAESLGDLGEQGNWIRAGYQVTVILGEKAGLMQPGDWIVSD